jgi:hypothetical protein
MDHRILHCISSIRYNLFLISKEHNLFFCKRRFYLNFAVIIGIVESIYILLYIVLPKAELWQLTVPESKYSNENLE